MSGDLTNGLNDPALYPNWMWILGTVLVVAVPGWIVYSIRRKKYLTYIDQIADRYADGDLDARGVHLALAGLMRALGTERTGRDLEVATVSEVRELVPVWPGLADVLQACEVPSFSGDDIPQGQPSHEAVTNVLTMAVEAVNV